RQDESFVRPRQGIQLHRAADAAERRARVAVVELLAERRHPAESELAGEPAVEAPAPAAQRLPLPPHLQEEVGVRARNPDPVLLAEDVVDGAHPGIADLAL